MTERGPIFDAAREAYEAAQGRLLGLIETPPKDQTVAEYRAHLRDALKYQQCAHKALLEAWG